MNEQKELIEKLRAVWEDINMLSGMFNILDRYKNCILEAIEIAGKILFELTGDKFYIQNKSLGGIKMAEEKTKSKWSWVEFFKSKSFIAVLIATTIFVIYFLGLFKIRNEIVDWIVAVVWGAVLLIFVFSRALETAIENMKITAELKAGAQLNVNAEVAKLLEAIKTITPKKEGGN